MFIYNFNCNIIDDFQQGEAINLMANRLRRSAPVSVQVKSQTESTANGGDDPNVVSHRKKHQVIGVKAVERVQNCALHAVKRVLWGGLARNSCGKERYIGVVECCFRLRVE